MIGRKATVQFRLAGGVRAAWAVALSLWASATISPPALAQPSTSIDPLWRPAPAAGELHYELALDIMAGGHQTVEWTVSGTPQALVEHRYRVGAHAVVGYWVSGRFALRAAAAVGGDVVRRAPPNELPPGWAWEASPGRVGLGASWRVGQESAWQPTLDLMIFSGHATPWEAQLAVTRMRDPVVLSGAVGVAADGRGGALLLVGGRAAFVANDKVSFTAGVTHATPGRMERLPLTTFTLGLHYALDGADSPGIGAEAVMSIAGGEARPGLRVVWSGTMER